MLVEISAGENGSPAGVDPRLVSLLEVRGFGVERVVARVADEDHVLVDAIDAQDFSSRLRLSRCVANSCRQAEKPSQPRSMVEV